MENKRGRPKKTKASKRSERIEFKMTIAEKKAFESAAEKAGLTVSDWIRTRLRQAAGI